jgi:hypothetical protein|tara:strand:- start:765 stop:893 length:129 start_codon:yes stop_codon:yes gene_type:complete
MRGSGDIGAPRFLSVMGSDADGLVMFLDASYEQDDQAFFSLR